MIKEALQYIVGLKEPYLTEIEGGNYTDKPLTRITLPLAEALNVTTLTALLDYLRDNKDELDLSRKMIHVCSPTQVSLISSLNADESRMTFLTSSAITPTFRFGSFYDSESFNIALQAMFVDADDRAAIIRMAGNLMEEGVKTSIDDGKTQTVVVKTGVKVVDYESVPNPVTLRPYRTFIEVEQPASKFIFRVREGGQLALFEADGGAWRNAAMQNIKDYLKDRLEDLDIAMTILA